jgi:hypothetical protein
MERERGGAMVANRRKAETEIACQQILLQDSSVYSIQWLVIPTPHAAGVTAPFLLDRYLSHIRRYTHSIIRPETSAGGIEFRLCGSAASVLSFAPPEFAAMAGSTAVHLRIAGGMLVQADECDRGKLSLLAEGIAGGIRITIQLSDYCPLLLGSRKPSRPRKLFYRLTQAYIHKAVTIKFLARLYRELAGEEIRVRLKKATVHGGEEI